MPKANWVTFTKRTNEPKLGWLINELQKNSINILMDGESFHAPILKIKEYDLEKAWEILTPVDDIPDDDVRFTLYKKQY